MTMELVSRPRRGPRFWWDSYVVMLRWMLAQQKVLLSTILVTQLFMGVGAALMYGFYLGSVDSLTATYLVSGIPALAIIPVGFVMVPILVMQEKFRGTHEFTWSLPVPRLTQLAATFTVFTAIALPVAGLSTWLAAIRFGLTVDASWTVVPAAILVSQMATSVGYAMAMAIPEPRLTNVITNIIIFLVLLFSPIVIPIERFPDWAAGIHRVLPFFHMSNLVRHGLSTGLVSGVGTSLAILLAWTGLGWTVAARVVARRG